jgi:hypothetical protein
MFHVGQLVICSAPLESRPVLPVIMPQKGVVYTVREIEVADGGKHPGDPFLRLVEITNELWQCRGRLIEPAFWYRRFRPLDDSLRYSARPSGMLPLTGNWSHEHRGDLNPTRPPRPVIRAGMHGSEFRIISGVRAGRFPAWLS